MEPTRQAPHKGSSVSLLHQGRQWEREQCHLKRNKFIVRLTLIGITMEVPFQRFVFADAKTSVRVSRLRFLGFVWITFRMLVAILLHDCQYARARALIWDWTIYYPMHSQLNLIRCFISVCSFHLCIKTWSSFNLQRRPFEATLLDFLLSPPPPPPPPPSSTADHEDALPAPTKWGPCEHYLRDRRHWFELSEQMRKSFRRTLWGVLPVCTAVIVSTTIRIGFIHQRERGCDIEMPFARLLAMLELNFCYWECVLSYLGSFNLGLLVKHDLLLQARRVELCLNELAAQFHSHHQGHKNHHHPRPQVFANHDDDDDYEKNDGYLLFCPAPLRPRERRVSATPSTSPGFQSYTPTRWAPSYDRARSVPRDLDRGAANGADKLGGLPQRKRLCCPRPLEFRHRQDNGRRSVCARDTEKAALGQFVEGQEEEKEEEEGHEGQEGQVVDEGGRPSKGNEAQQRLAAAIRQAQTRVTLFLKCIDSHKPAISYLGSVLLIWLLTSLSWVPVLFVNWNSLNTRRSNIIYATSCFIAVSSNLVFTAICAAVYQRAVRLAGAIFRLCAKNHSKKEALRWNKIFLIWFSPNRCALQIGSFFQLTYLNIFKSISFLVSGLTFILNYMSN